MPEPQYEVYVQPFRVTEWRDDSVFRTEPLDCGWYPDAVVKANRPRESGVIYASANDDFANTHMTIRLKRD